MSQYSRYCNPPSHAAISKTRTPPPASSSAVYVSDDVVPAKPYSPMLPAHGVLRPPFSERVTRGMQQARIDGSGGVDSMEWLQQVRIASGGGVDSMWGREVLLHSQVCHHLAPYSSPSFTPPNRP